MVLLKIAHHRSICAYILVVWRSVLIRREQATVGYLIDQMSSNLCKILQVVIYMYTPETSQRSMVHTMEESVTSLYVQLFPYPEKIDEKSIQSPVNPNEYRIY
jgi:hypothetical protein